MAHLIVAIMYGKGEQYEGQMTGKLFATFITEKFDRVIANSDNPQGKLFLQDGHPSQNSKVARVELCLLTIMYIGYNCLHYY